MPLEVRIGGVLIGTLTELAGGDGTSWLARREESEFVSTSRAAALAWMVK